MINTIHRLKEFLKYQQKAKTKYYLHSPFVYQFYLHILEGISATEIQNINKIRNKHLHNQNSIVIEDMGTVPGIKNRLIASIASKTSIPDHYGKVLYLLANYFKPATILELGTCLGLGTAYLASGNPVSKVTTIEGSEALSKQASQTFTDLGFNNIHQVTGNFDHVLPKILADMDNVDLVFIDGNHRYEPTLRYFELLMQKAHDKTILVFDDIYWSLEMTEAWEQIKLDPRVKLTIDIHRFGIVFLQSDKLAKEDFVLRY